MPQRRVLPTQQGFGLAHMAVPQIELGLVAQEQLAFDHGAAQVANQGDLALVGEVAVRLVDLQVPRQIGRVVPGDGRAVDQLFHLLPISRVRGDADTHLMAHFVIADAQGFGQRPMQLVGAGHGRVDLGVFQQQQKLTAGDARGGVAGQQAAGQAAAGLAQHVLDTFGAKPFVDDSVVFNPHVQQHHRPPCADRTAQALHGQGTVGQSGERVMQGIVGQLPFAQGDAALHGIERPRQQAELVVAAHPHRGAVVTGPDPFSGLHQRIERA